MKKVYLLLIGVLLITLVACNNTDTKETKDNNDKAIEESVENEGTMEIDFDMMDSWLTYNKDYLEKKPTLGDEEAPVSILVFSDYKCSYCAQWDYQHLPELIEELVDTGKANIKAINFPFLTDSSFNMALAVESIYQQNEDLYWEYSDLAYKNQNSIEQQWNENSILKLAKEVEGIDVDLLEKDYNEETHYKNVEEDLNFAMQHEITGTPSIIINGYRVDNAFDIDAIINFSNEVFEHYK